MHSDGKENALSLLGGLGITNLLGDLGGGKGEGTNGLRDFDLASSRYVIGLGYRYFYRQNIAVRGNLLYARLYGDDKNSGDDVRKARGLKFRSPLVELSVQVEYHFLQEQSKGMYRLRGVKGIKALKLDAYAFLGVGAFWFNPKGELNGKWHALQPLGTEGQGIRPGLDKYKRVQLSIPLGLGIKKKLDRKWSVGMELTMRLTTTDYLDDVSDEYYENHLIRDKYGDVAAQLANPPGVENFLDVSYNSDNSVAERQQRGDPGDKDTYMFLMFNVNYKFAKRRRSLPKF
jgi:hypothetical protein